MRSSQRRPSVHRNVAYSFARWVFLVIVMILVTPYLVKRLGVDAYGVLVAVSNILGYFAFINFSLGRATTKFLSEEKAQHDDTVFGRILSTGLVIHGLIGFAVAGLVWALSDVLVSSMLKIPISLQPVARWVFRLGGVGFIFMLQSQVLRAVPEAFHRFSISSCIQVLSGTAVSLGAVVIVATHFGLREIAVWNLIVAIVMCCVWYLAAKKLAPNMRIASQVDRKILGQVFNFGLLVTVTNLVTLGSTLLDRTWIVVAMGTGALTYYSIPATAARYIHGLIGSLLLPLFPLASLLGSTGSSEQLRSVYLRATKYAVSLIMFLAVTMSILSFRILRCWMGFDFATQSASTLAVLALAWGIWAIAIVPFQIIEGLGHPGINVYLGIGLTLVSATGYLVLIPYFGILGAAYGKLIATLIVVPIYIAYVQRRLIHVRLSDLWSDSFRIVILAGITTGFVEWMLNRILPTGLIWLGICVTIGSTVWVWALIVLGFFGTLERQWLHNQKQRLVSFWSSKLSRYLRIFKK